jgi:hypothetical protein
MGISTVEFNLSMTCPEACEFFTPGEHFNTGEYLTARTYSITVKDADGAEEKLLENLSIGQLVMALCLERAVAKEKDIIDTMNSLNTTSSQLEGLTEIEAAVVGADGRKGESVDLTAKALTYMGSSYTYSSFLEKVIGLSSVPGTANSESSSFISILEDAMDQRNSINQQTMIELQSSTSKRDQAYDMISNILKSLGNVITGNLNNL